MNSGAFLYVIGIGVCAGVAAALVFNITVVATLFLLALSVVCVIVAAFSYSPKILLTAAACAALALGIIRADAYLESQRQENLPNFAGQSVHVQGVVVNDPERRDTSLHVTINVDLVNGASAKGTLLAILDRNETIFYGDTLALGGVLDLPQPFLTDTGHMFDYPGYLRAQGVSVQMQRGVVESRTQGGASIQGTLFEIKHLFERSLEKVFPEPENSLLQGILLGERRGIPQELNDAFIKSSLVHVVVLSGHNITVVSEGVFRLLSFLPRTFSFSLGGVLMILFALATGAGATTTRALAMALIALLARYMHRSALAMRSLLAAATAMVLWNPEALLHDPSFILSVLATFGLITLSPWLEQKLSWIKNTSTRSIASSTIAVQIFVLPALLYLTGVLSLLALPANILALPAVPFAMLMGFISGLVGFIHPALAFAPALLCDWLLKYIIAVASTTAAVPFSSAVIAPFGLWVVLAAYIPLTVFAIWRYVRSAPQQHSNSSF